MGLMNNGLRRPILAQVATTVRLAGRILLDIALPAPSSEQVEPSREDESFLAPCPIGKRA